MEYSSDIPRVFKGLSLLRGQIFQMSFCEMSDMTDPHPFSSGFLAPPSPVRPDLDLFDDANLQKIYQEMVDEGETRPFVVEYC